ncbi:MAG: cobyric acid synthase [Methylothermaceae bacteria B42]|nr:MAG: cobyric acid synthase [Methylothermaceae bacteria B42]HHJ38433.1 ParA family protein [Methylothermaceae bacterium]
MRRVIFNQKGGVGKSTITCNLAAISAQEGKSTLVVDLDIQGNTTHYLMGHAIDDPEQTLARFFRETVSLNPFGKNQKASARDLIQNTPYDNLYILASHPEMEALQSRLESRYKIYKLREALEQLNDFEYIYIDTPPILNFFSRSALIAAEKCLIPFDCDAFSRDALYKLLEAITEVKMDHNPHLEVEGVVVNQFQGRAKLPQMLVEELSKEGHPVLSTRISPSVKVRESHSESKPLIHYAPDHKLTEEFKTLYRELHH